MNKSPSYRTCLLEQLESRCMLAGGILSQSFDNHAQHDYQPNDAVDQSQVVDRQGPSEPVCLTIGLDDSRLPSSLSDKPTSDRSIGRSSDNNGFNLFHLAVEANSQSANDGNAVRTNPMIVVIDVRVSSALPKTPNTASQVQNSSILDSSDHASNSDSSRSAKLQTGSSTQTASDADVDDEESANAVLIRNQVATGEQAKISVPAISISENNIVQSPPMETTNATTGEMIETLPLLRRNLNPTAEPDTEERWQLDTQSIERIREVAELPDSPSPDDSDRITDAAIASWFNGQTGLMEIEATGDLHAPIDLTESIVDVVLDATVGLHRSVDLIALAAPESDAIPDDVRSAILAAIAAEQSSPIADVVREPTQARLGSVAYCATAVVAGTVAAVARRRKKAKMEYTRR
ncbi:hypothetical protein Q31b_54340 [Novipirellula aureliae]|uniref:Uncharacterized protein n=1 Tax=Novipirellula aureliae TaxID=2527966 RepID=A0A5C6DF64_9BACT|nr:hypothetical protein [Novipirellula aureliae]TWU35338.1 hypothetical protein Q31b_54340 [Novipirellula aureliae]